MSHPESTLRPGITDQFLLEQGVEVLNGDSKYSFRIPYRRASGELLDYSRWRLRVPNGNQKYYQPPNSDSRAFFPLYPPGFKSNHACMLEGEFKTLAAAEAGYAAFGLPGLHRYTAPDDVSEPLLLPGIIDWIELIQCSQIVFIGDSDTISNIEYFRSAGVLARAIPPNVSVSVLPLPLDRPKGLDDVRGQDFDAFPAWFDEQLTTTIPVDRKQSFLTAATIWLEQRAEAIRNLGPVERERHMARVVRMAAYAKLSGEAVFAIEKFYRCAQAVTKLTVPAFNKSVTDEIGRLKRENGEAEPEEQVNEKISFYDSIEPAEHDTPLYDLIQADQKRIRRYVVAHPDVILLAACWAASSHAQDVSLFLPPLVFRGELETGKTTFMKTVARTCHRAYSILPTTVIHRLTAVYQGVYVLDESLKLDEFETLRMFFNAGFSRESTHPIDNPILPKYDMETGQLLEFKPFFLKMFAGQEDFLAPDTLSRSIIIETEHYSPDEGRTVLPYSTCNTSEDWLPIYRGYLRYWSEDHKNEYLQTQRNILEDPSIKLLARHRDKFVPLIAVSRMAGNGLEAEVLRAIDWFLSSRNKEAPSLVHQLMCDIALVLFRQVAMHKRQRDGKKCDDKPIEAVYQPETGLYLLPTDKLVPLLLKLPERPWSKCGQEKTPIDSNQLWGHLRKRRLKATRFQTGGERYRGLLFDRPSREHTDEPAFCEQYERYRQPGDPTFKDVVNELERELDGPTTP
jgi:hypothetical protein